jgi:hypothetical protein
VAEIAGKKKSQALYLICPKKKDKVERQWKTGEGPRRGSKGGRGREREGEGGRGTERMGEGQF